MITIDEFLEWTSLSDLLLGKNKKSPAELECALEKDDWFYLNARGRIMQADSIGREFALDLLTSYYKKDIKSRSYRSETQPPSHFLNTEDDPGLCRFRWSQSRLPKFEATNLVNFKLDSIPGTMPHVGIGKLAVKIAWEIEQSTGARATAKEVMAKLQKCADDGTDSDILKKSDRANRAVIWFTSKSNEKSYGTDACGKTLSKWNKTRP